MDETTSDQVPKYPPGVTDAIISKLVQIHAGITG